MLNVHVSIAECYLECGDEKVAEADAAVTKAGTVISASSNNTTSMNVNDSAIALIKDGSVVLRHKSVYAHVLDIKRKFLPAALRYHELSKADEQFIDADDLLCMLGRATTCAILAQKTPQQQRILGLVSSSITTLKTNTHPIQFFFSNILIACLKNNFHPTVCLFCSLEYIDYER